jgi:predicted MFS family arabinose efflux permease
MKIILKEEKEFPKWLVILLAVSCGLIVANLYYAQPLVSAISSSIGIPSGASGFIVTMTQIGYVIGLLFIVPLSDLLENKRLVTVILLIAVIGLITVVFARNTSTFLIGAIMIGIGSVAAQILVPYSAYLASDKQRGRMVGNVMSGLLLGIMFARPVSGFLSSIYGWQFIFALSAIITVLLSILLYCLLPKRTPTAKDKYSTIIKSLWYLFKTTPVLRRRSLYQASLFGAFSLFWTVVPLWLAEHYHLSQKEIALFAFAGVTGAVMAPIAGRLADRGLTKPLTGCAFILASGSFVLSQLFQNNLRIGVFVLCAAAILLDMAVSGNLVLGQQAIYALGDEIRGRVNGVFMAVFFTGGAFGSAFGGWAYANGSWAAASLIGFILPVLALLYFLTEKKK